MKPPRFKVGDKVRTMDIVMTGEVAEVHEGQPNKYRLTNCDRDPRLWARHDGPVPMTHHINEDTIQPADGPGMVEVVTPITFDWLHINDTKGKGPGFFQPTGTDGLGFLVYTDSLDMAQRAASRIIYLCGANSERVDELMTSRPMVRVE